MEIKIYQIKDFENSKYMFMPWSMAEEYFNLNDYEEVYNYLHIVRPSKENGYSLVANPNKILENIFRTFNVNRPEDFKGHSLSVSDVVSINDDLYYCDFAGWRRI